MISIREKRQQQRKDIRRQYLENYFKEKRLTCFGYQSEHNKLGRQEWDISRYEFLLGQSLKLNCFAKGIRESKFLEQLQTLLSETMKTSNILKVKFLLIIISNALKDDLQVDDKIALYRLSAILFQRLSLFKFNPNDESQKQKFQTIVKTLHIQTLIFYMYTVNESSRYLDEQDQIEIQIRIYPAFVNVLMYAFKHPEEIHNVEEFQRDIWRFFKSIFDDKDEFYQQGNRMKAQRLQQFYRQILKGHMWLIKNCQQFLEQFGLIQLILLKSYTRLIKVVQQIPEFFILDKSVFEIMDRSLSRCSRKGQQSRLNSVFGIMQKMIRKRVRLDEVQMGLRRRDVDTGVMVFERGIDLVMQRSQIKYRTMQMLQMVVTCRYQQGLFKQLIDEFQIKLIDMCACIMVDFSKQEILKQYQRKIVLMGLTIMRVLIQKQKIGGKRGDRVSVLRRFESQSGRKAIEEIWVWFSEIDMGDDMEVRYVMEYIDEILGEIQIDMEVEVGEG